MFTYWPTRFNFTWHKLHTFNSKDVQSDMIIPQPDENFQTKYITTFK